MTPEQRLAYDSAVFYTCDDGVEHLSHETEREALYRYLEGLALPEHIDDDTELPEVTVYAYARQDVDLGSWADGLVDFLCETLSEDEEISRDDHDALKGLDGACEEAQGCAADDPVHSWPEHAFH